MLTEPESHVVHERHVMVLVERESVGRSGPDRMLQRHIRSLAAARLAVRRAPVWPAVSAARAAPGAPRGRAVQLAAGAEAGVRRRLPRRRRRRHHLLGGGVLVVLDGVRRADRRARTRGFNDGTNIPVFMMPIHHFSVFQYGVFRPFISVENFRQLGHFVQCFLYKYSKIS